MLFVQSDQVVDGACFFVYSSIMVDNQAVVPKNNIRGLLYHLAAGLDVRLSSYRKGTRYASVRHSDVRVFVQAHREPQTISDLSRTLRISRQAVHASVHRLCELKVVELVPDPQDRREKIVVMTERGMSAQRTAQQQVIMLENEIAEVIGREGLEQLRQMLEKLHTRFSEQAILPDA
jgi:DNA-binding MarR family transcriptional regulator